MTTARIAVTFSVILSLFHLSTHARHTPHLPDDSSSTALVLSENIEDHRTAVLLPPERSSSANGNSIPAADLSRTISHSLRLPFHCHGGFDRPFSIRFRRRGCRHSALRPRTEIPYGEDMIPGGGFPAKKIRPFTIRASPSVSTVDADGREIWKKEVRPWNPEVEYEKMMKKKKEEHEEFEHKKKNIMKKMKKIWKRFWEFLNLF